MSTVINGGVVIAAAVLAGSAGTAVSAPVYESFMDDVQLQALNGVTSTANGGLTANAPTKYGSNPVLSGGPGAWNAFYNYVGWIDDGSGTLKLYAAVLDVPNNLYLTYLTTTDGLTFTLPNLGLVTYGGNTNNNILLSGVVHNTPGPYYNAGGAANQVYLVGLEDSLAKITIYGGTNSTTLTSIKDAGTGVVHNTWTANRIAKRTSDGHWFLYGQVDYDNARRSIALMISDTTDITGAYTYQGEVISAPSRLTQFYSMAVSLIEGVYYGFASRYNETSARLYAISLLTSRDGLAWKMQNENWITASSNSGDWDYGILLETNALLAGLGTNEWWYYYTGKNELHSAPTVTDGAVGIAKIPYQRIGQANGTGVITTVQINTGSGPYTLTLNANGTGGSVKVALLNTNGSPIAGYSNADMDAPITTDTYGATVTWGGGNRVPANSSFKLQFTLASAYLYHYSLT